MQQIKSISELRSLLDGTGIKHRRGAFKAGACVLRRRLILSGVRRTGKGTGRTKETFSVCAM